MSAPVSRLRDPSLFLDEEDDVAEWSAYERFERSYVARRKRPPGSGVRPTVKGLLPAAAETPETPPPSTWQQAPPPPTWEAPPPSTHAPQPSTQTPPRPSREEPFDAGITPHALLVFAALHTVPLLAWVLSEAPWTWRSASTFATAAGALVVAAALRRRPSRRLVLAGLAIAGASFARVVGVPWTWSTWIAFLLTAALAVVLARAALPRWLARDLFGREP
jgi:hypothetical protein